jgi:hypothetical protein
MSLPPPVLPPQEIVIEVVIIGYLLFCISQRPHVAIVVFCLGSLLMHLDRLRRALSNKAPAGRMSKVLMLQISMTLLLCCLIFERRHFFYIFWEKTHLALVLHLNRGKSELHVDQCCPGYECNASGTCQTRDFVKTTSIRRSHTNQSVPMSFSTPSRHQPSCTKG